MFNLKYNTILILQVVINFLNLILLIKIFGVSKETDMYFLLITIFSAIYLIQLLPIEQFMYFYNDSKFKDVKLAENFYYFAFTVSFVIGVLSFIIISLCMDYVIKLFVYNLSGERFAILKNYFYWYKYILLCMPINYIFSTLFIAESKILYSYISSILPILFIFVSLLLCLFYNLDLIIMIKLSVLGYILTSLIYFYLIKIFLNYRIKFCFYHNYGYMFIINSIGIRFGHNINNFGLPFFTNNFLSSLESGYISQFYYAQRIALALQNIITGPSNRILQSRISYNISRNNKEIIKNDVFNYLKIFSPLLMIIFIIVYFLLPYILKIISFNISENDIFNIQKMFVFFMFWSFILFFEAPFDMILIADKNSKVFIIVNLIFILSYVLNYFLLGGKLYSILYSLIISQFISFILYFILVNSKIGFYKCVYVYKSNKR